MFYSTIPSTWFALPLVAPYALILVFRALSSQSNIYHKYINEGLCTILWLSWCFELQVINRHISSFAVVQGITFILLWVQPRVFSGAFGNPCFLMVEYLRGNVKQKTALFLFIIQLVCVPVSMVMVYFFWWALSPFSDTHEDMFHYERGDFLFSSIPIGILCEGTVAFLAFVPPYFFKPGEVLYTVNALFYMSMGLLIGPFTGSFSNPLPITAFSFFFSKQTWMELMLVYWTGAVAGSSLGYTVLYKNQVKTTKQF